MPKIKTKTNAEVLRERRVELGLTRAQLSHRAACSTSMLAMLESGFTPQRSEVLQRVLAALEAAEAEARG